MGLFLILLLALQLFNATTLSKILNGPSDAVDSVNDKLNDYSFVLPAETPNEYDQLLSDVDALVDAVDITNDDIPMIHNFEDKTELKFREPIDSVNIDYSRNAVVLKFHKKNAKSVMRLSPIENEKKKSVQDNFMRFGKRFSEDFPMVNGGYSEKNHGMRFGRNHQSSRDARGDNFMRFGRSDNLKNDFMRFGRSPGQDSMRFSRAAPSKDFIRFGRSAAQDFMRFGRSPSQDFMRFGRTPGQDFMRFGRTPSQDFIRFGRAGQDDFMRFGRAPHEDFMRFGRNNLKVPVNTNFMRNSRPDNFMRFGRASPETSDNVMRFGKSMQISNDKNASQPATDTNELKEAVKLMHEAGKNDDNENPVDKAIKVLFDKHQQLDTNDKAHTDELNDELQHQHDVSNDFESDMDYYLKESK